MVSSDTSQREVIDFLSGAEAYGLRSAAVERRETHGAIVFLAADKAYKLKRAVRLAYMDYSTLQARKRMCERELIVNRRTAPELYLGVQPIVRGKNGRLCFGAGDEGEIVDWVVVMARFDEDDLLETLRQHGRLTPDVIGLLGEAIPTSQTRRRRDGQRTFGLASPAIRCAGVVVTGTIGSHA